MVYRYIKMKFNNEVFIAGSGGQKCNDRIFS